MNKTQRNFKKEISKTLYHEEKKAKKGIGAFSNNLFSLRFYGYNNNPDYKYKPVLVRMIIFILKLIFFIVKIAFIIISIPFAITILLTILKLIK